MKLSSSNIVLMIVISLLLVLLGHILILERTPNNEIEALTIRGDTNAYVSMIQGHWMTVPSPFKFRVLVPFLASLLPLSPTDSLKLISYISLFFSYLLILLTCAKLGLHPLHSAVGLFSVWASTWHLYNYHNPYLTDAFGLLAISVMIFALFNGFFLVFLVSILLGVLARETTIFLVPAWLFKGEWRRGILLVVVSIIVLLAPRYLLSSGTDQTLVSHFDKLNMLQQPFIYAKEVFYSWGFIWFLSMIGVWFLPKDKIALALVIYISLLCGAALTSFIATDTGRMFSILTPILAIACAWFYAELIKRKRIWGFVFVVLIIFKAFVSIPNVVFGINSWVFGLPRIALLITELIYAAVVLAVLGKAVQQEIKGKARFLFYNIRRSYSEIIKKELVHRHL